MSDETRIANRRIATTFPRDPSVRPPAHNCPRDPSAPATTKAPLLAHHGRREKMTCNIPGSMAAPAFKALNDALNANFGGFTRLPMEGGWVPLKGGAGLLEAGWSYNVSYAHGIASLRRTAGRLFITAAHALGEEAVHIEVSEFEAFHFDPSL